jgi:hypothetical protein
VSFGLMGKFYIQLIFEAPCGNLGFQQKTLSPNHCLICNSYSAEHHKRNNHISTMLAYKTPQLACHQFTNNRSPRRSRITVRPCAIGFDLTGATSSKSAEKRADELARSASSMLFYRGVLLTRPSQSFMDVLLHLQKGSPLKLLDHYGELYKSIANDGLSSWESYLLDQVLRGTDNPFAKAAARNEATSHMLPSVIHDMSVIKELAVSEYALASWVRETVSSVSDEWLTAATALSSGNTTADNGVTEPFEIPNTPPAHILPPLSKHQRAEMRSRLAKEQSAAAAAELLQNFHSGYDYGILSMHRVLKWSQDRMQAQDVLEGVVNPQLSNDIEKSAAGVLAAALDAGLLCLDLANRKQGCDPIFIGGSGSRNAYTLAMHVLNNLENLVSPEHAIAASSVRTIILPHSQISTISELAWTMSQHPRMYFAVVCPGVPDMDSELPIDLATILAGGDGVSWPSNALFIGCSGITVPTLRQVPGVRISLSN